MVFCLLLIGIVETEEPNRIEKYGVDSDNVVEK